jgi:large subunit ribosomal protein L21
MRQRDSRPGQEAQDSEAIMYAVIRAGGKQYRVAPGDVIRIEKVAPAGGKRTAQVEFTEVLAVSGEPGKLAKPQPGAHVTGEVVGEGRGEKILVFHYKRKKQYKRLRGHRQPFTAVRITEIAFDGQRFTAPGAAPAAAKPAKKAAAGAPEAAAKPAARARSPKSAAQTRRKK